MREPRKADALAFLLAIFGGELSAQALQYGKEDELQGTTKIFVDTGDDLELRNNIVSELLDDLPKPSPLIVVDRADEAELILLAISTTTRRGNPYTELKAIKIVGDGKEKRLLWQWGDENTFRFGRRPSSRAADRFIVKWKKYNNDLLRRNP